MNQITVYAPAKINLTLDVLNKRPDGYHDLRMVMQSVDVCDKITITKTNAKDNRIVSSLKYLPSDGRNLALAAANRFCEKTGYSGARFAIELQKSIPVCAGLGGGSSDAAAVFHGLNKLLNLDVPLSSMLEWSLELGSDVPYCLAGGTKLAEGRGEMLSDLPPLPDCWIVLCKPPVSVSTKEAFGMIEASRLKHRPDLKGMHEALESGSLANVARRLFNVFEEPISERLKDIKRIHNLCIDHGALGAVMSGTGPTVFALCNSESVATQVFNALSIEYDSVFKCKPL